MLVRDIREALELVRAAARSDYLGFHQQAEAEMDEAAQKLAALFEPAPIASRDRCSCQRVPGGALVKGTAICLVHG